MTATFVCGEFVESMAVPKGSVTVLALAGVYEAALWNAGCPQQREIGLVHTATAVDSVISYIPLPLEH